MRDRLAEYREFIASKAIKPQKYGFDPKPLPNALKPHQRAAVEFALERGKSASFLDCVSGDTLIETINGTQRIDQLERAGKPIVVLSMGKDGKAKWSLATAPFQKGRGTMFKITLSSGRTIRATAGHRFLTPAGWTACGDLCAEQLLICAGDLPRTNSDNAPSTSRQDVRHCSETLEGSTDRYSFRHRRYDRLLRQASNIAQGLAPSLTYALALDGCYLHRDGLARRSEYSPYHPAFCPPSTPGLGGRGWSVAGGQECSPLSCGSISSGANSHTSLRSLSGERRSLSWRERLQDQFQRFVGVQSFDLPHKVASIVSIQELGEEIKYDMHVPGDECYLGNGVWCHNTGLGKSLIELEYARQCAEETRKPSLILTPLAVAGQMVREGQKFGIDARQIREQSEVGAGIMVANYERLPKLDPEAFGAIILDESSILKSFAGQTRNRLQQAFEACPFKLAATATPSPNDHMELGNHAEFLGVMRQQEMLSKWFINDTSTASQDWRLKGHAVDDFWRWVASWSRCATLPSDLGGDDAGYVLPEIDRHLHMVSADRSQDTDGMLFRIPEMSATSFHKEKRLTIQERCHKAAELANAHDKPVTIWCESNEESALLTKLIPDAVEVHGSQTPEEKERRLLGFADGDFRVIVTKPKLAGFGVNWQHCAHAVFASISFSYEQHYQAVRRSHRFGQQEAVTNDIIIADTEKSIWEVIHIKGKKHDEMKSRMASAMRQAQSESTRRVVYDRPLDLEFPAWIKEGKS